MNPISTARAQMPLPAAAAPAAVEAASRQPVAQKPRPVAEPLREDSVRQPRGSGAALRSELLDRDEGRHPAAEARQAAEAAREAYLRASRAAGINPLPLPRV